MRRICYRDVGRPITRVDVGNALCIARPHHGMKLWPRSRKGDSQNHSNRSYTLSWNKTFEHQQASLLKQRTELHSKRTKSASSRESTDLGGAASLFCPLPAV
jgi:hypothetical protein